MNYSGKHIELKGGQLVKRFAAFLFLTLVGLGFLQAMDIGSIDDIYMNEMPRFRNNVNKIAGKIWPGMTIGPFCIFRINGPAIMMNHPNPPDQAKHPRDNRYVFSQSDFKLMGATNTKINGLLTAHNDYGQNFYSTANQFYAELFHELHHIYQLDHVKNLNFDNPAIQLTYPEYIINDAMKQYENEVLLEMLNCSQRDFPQFLNRFYTSRNLRRQLIGDKYSDYEKAVESVEGPATYCEYQYMME
jgi:hypothetical protein